MNVKLYDEKKLKDLLEHAWLDLGDVSKLKVPTSFLEVPNEEKRDALDVYLLRHLRKPENFYLTCKTIFNIELLPAQVIILQQLWSHPFPLFLGSRGLGKTFLLALYAMLRALFTQGAKIIIVSAGFRQAKMLFEYCETIWHNSPVLRNIVGKEGRNGRINGPRRDVDRCEMIVGDSFIYAIPIGDGQKIRGLRANYIISDEFQSMNEEIYENVVQGFANVSSSPVKNVQKKASAKILAQMGVPENAIEDSSVFTGNQSIISGTAYYSFNHFYKYFNNYKRIIESRGDNKKLEEIFNGDVPKNFNWKNYCIIRIPIELLQEGYMDENIVSRAKATIHSSIFAMEYGCVFATDSNGFFKRTLIESCVTKTPINDIQFEPVLKGNRDKQYIFGIDPASEKDNFSIIVLEVNDDHRRIVHCWTTTRKNHQDRIKAGSIEEYDFYAYCAKKIRELMRLFPCEAIGIDAQGGGIAIEEALHDIDKLGSGEEPLWRAIDPDKPQDSDDYKGKHILHMIQFAKAEWTSAANHGLRKDFEDKAILFPFSDSLSTFLAAEEDISSGRLYDTLEDCVFEIEELKDELATIVHTQTGNSGRDRWDTPEIKEPGGKKGRLRKDRYSALVIANMIARTFARAIKNTPEYQMGGYAGDFVNIKPEQIDMGQMYTGPAWYNDASKSLAEFYGGV